MATVAGEDECRRSRSRGDRGDADEQAVARLHAPPEALGLGRH
jgi:hypothetical protein